MTAEPVCPLRVERRLFAGVLVADILYDEIVPLPDGQRLPVARSFHATGNVLGEKILAVLAENERLRERVKELEKSKKGK